MDGAAAEEEKEAVVNLAAFNTVASCRGSAGARSRVYLQCSVEMHMWHQIRHLQTDDLCQEFRQFGLTILGLVFPTWGPAAAEGCGAAAAVVARSMNRYLSFTRIGAAAAAVRASLHLRVRPAHRCQSEELVSI